MNIDGRAIAGEIFARAKTRAAKLGRAPRVLALVANESPATRSYLAIKGKRALDAGCELLVEHCPETVSTEELQLAITSSEADAIIVQLPLPRGVATKAVCDAIPVEKDADVLSTAARYRFEHGEADALLPPVVAAVKEILERSGVVVAGKRAVIVGEGFLVGQPAAAWLRTEGATVVSTNGSIGDLGALLRSADVIISGAGSPGLITPDMLKEGVVLIDAGTSESSGKIAGDADPACAQKCALFTPVPGGVGPIAVAALFENATFLAERQ